MILTIYLFWALFASSLNPRVIWREMRKMPGPFIAIAVILFIDFVVRRYVLGG